MTLKFLKQTPEIAFSRLEKDLKTVDPTVNLIPYKGMTSRRLKEEIAKLKTGETKTIRESVYGTWLTNDDFMVSRMLREALEFLLERRSEQEKSEVLVPGFSYYRGVKQFGETIQGKFCVFSESREPSWVDIPRGTKVSALKAFELIRHGSDEDFRKVYVEMADGRTTGLMKIELEHITESSAEALAAIDSYCESRWEGPWPWESRAPFKLKSRIEENVEMRVQSLNEMRNRFSKLVARLNEDEMQKFEVVSMTQDMIATVDSMIKDLGKISSDGIEAAASARSIGGSGDEIVHALGEPLNQAADALSQLKASLEHAVSSLNGGGNDGAEGGMPAPMGDDMGSGLDNDSTGLANDISDVNLDGNDGERPMKMA